jgi:hypothetical protein
MRAAPQGRCARSCSAGEAVSRRDEPRFTLAGDCGCLSAIETIGRSLSYIPTFRGKSMKTFVYAIAALGWAIALPAVAAPQPQAAAAGSVAFGAVHAKAETVVHKGVVFAPSTWALAIAGLGLAGVMIRRRNRGKRRAAD